MPAPAREWPYHPPYEPPAPGELRGGYQDGYQGGYQGPAYPYDQGWGSEPPTGWPPTQPLVPVGPPPRRRSGALVAGAVVVVLLLGVAAFFASYGSAVRLSPNSNRLAQTQAQTQTQGQNQGQNQTGAAPRSLEEAASQAKQSVVNIQSRVPGAIEAGTGILLNDTGRILTNNHVIEGAQKTVVEVVGTGDSYSATIVATDPGNDIAVLQLDGASGLPTAAIGNSDGVQVGDEVAAIGNAGGEGGDPTVSAGTVLALRKPIVASDPSGRNAERLSDTIQVQANVMSGQSGGPLVDAEGKVVGVTTAASASAGRSRYRTSANQGFAIPINKAMSIADALLSGAGSTGGNSGSSGSSGSGGGSSTQSPNRGYLGVQATDGSTGVAVTGVQADGPADQAGIAAGDVIVAIDGATVATTDDLIAALQTHQSGDQVPVTWRTAGGQRRGANITLAAG